MRLAKAIGRDLNAQLGQLPYEQLARLVVVNALIDPEAGAELKTNPEVRMIVFSDLVAGQAAR